MLIRKIAPGVGALALVAAVWASPAFASAGGTPKHANATEKVETGGYPCSGLETGAQVGSVTFNQPTSAKSDHNLSVDINITNGIDGTYYVWLGYATTQNSTCTWGNSPYGTITVTGGLGSFQFTVDNAVSGYYSLTLTTDEAGFDNFYTTPQTHMSILNS